MGISCLTKSHRLLQELLTSDQGNWSRVSSLESYGGLVVLLPPVASFFGGFHREGSSVEVQSNVNWTTEGVTCCEGTQEVEDSYLHFLSLLNLRCHLRCL